MSQTNDYDELTRKIKSLIEEEGFFCPDFFAIESGSFLEIRARAYKDHPEVEWKQKLKELYPEIYSKCVDKWVSISKMDIMIVGLDEFGDQMYIRAKDRHDIEWIINLEDIMSAI